MSKIRYKDYTIQSEGSFRGHALWSYWNDDYDGAPDGNQDGGAFHGSLEKLKESIDEMIEEKEERISTSNIEFKKVTV